MIKKTDLPKAFATAFRRLLPEMHSRKLELLRYMMAVPNRSATPDVLMKHLEVSDVIVVNQTIGQLGLQVYRALSEQHPEGLTKGSFQYWHVIAEANHPDGGDFAWKLRPEVVEALNALNFSPAPMRIAEELTSEELPKEFFEGDWVRRYVNGYERSVEGRSACIDAKGVRCVICDFDFGNFYGEEMRGYIHVHHMKPLSTIRRKYRLDPIKDLEPVCPNCHAVIHAKTKARSLEAVRKMIRARQAASN